MHLRFLPLLLAVVLAPCLAHAQQQEHTLAERIMRPDMAQGAREQTKAYNGGKAFSSSASGATKSYSGAHAFSLRNFFTRSYSGGKSYSANQYNLSQKPGSDLTKTASSQDTGKVYATSAAPVSQANGIEKSYAQTDDRFATAQAKMEGKSQKSLDLQNRQKPMTIDEVRELLNKSK